MELNTFEAINQSELENICGGNFWHSLGKGILVAGISAGVSVLTGNPFIGALAGVAVDSAYDDAIPVY